MSADLLREAARLMRERAEGARVGPWVADPDAEMWANPIVCGPEYADEEGETHRFVIAECYGFSKPENAAHVASMHPAVALAVADLLDQVAANLVPLLPLGPTEQRAIAVAGVYLGRQS